MKDYPILYCQDSTPFESLKGETIAEINQTEDTVDIETVTGRRFHMYHSQDCCESVRIEDVVGDLQDLVGDEILLAEEATSDKHPEGHVASEYDESFTWTFYKLATVKANVTMRWLGESNGYYSESVDFIELKPDNAGES